MRHLFDQYSTTIAVAAFIAACGEGAPSAPTFVTTIQFDSRGTARATSPGPTNWCVKSAPLVELWFDALDPMFSPSPDSSFCRTPPPAGT
jgi:hypothetical protein